MKKSYLLIFAFVLLAAPLYGQKTAPKTFDNFDRSQGIELYLPPAPAIVNTVAKKGKRGRRGAKMQVAVTDKFAKKTAKTGWSVAVTDGLAQRESITTFGGSKLAMGASSSLKGF